MKHEKSYCVPIFDGAAEPPENEVSMEIEEAHVSDDECFSEEIESQRQAEIDFKLKKLLERQQKLTTDPQSSTGKVSLSISFRLYQIIKVDCMVSGVSW